MAVKPWSSIITSEYELTVENTVKNDDKKMELAQTYANCTKINTT